MGAFDGDRGERNKKILVGALIALCVTFAAWRAATFMGYFQGAPQSEGGPAAPPSPTTAQTATDASKPPPEPPPEATPLNRRRVADPDYK